MSLSPIIWDYNRSLDPGTYVSVGVEDLFYTHEESYKVGHGYSYKWGEIIPVSRVLFTPVTNLYGHLQGPHNSPYDW